MNLELSSITPEIRAAIAAIASLGSSPVVIRESIVLEIPDPAVGGLLKRLLSPYLAGKTLPVKETATPPSDRAPRACVTCGKMYEPVRKDQRFCKPDCKKNKPTQEGPQESAPLPRPTPAARGGSITWELVDGPKAGEILTPGDLNTWIASGWLQQGQLLRHSARGLFRLTPREGRKGMVPFPCEESQSQEAGTA